MVANQTQPPIATATPNPSAKRDALYNALMTQNTTQQASASFGEYKKNSAQLEGGYLVTPESANGCLCATNEGNIPDRDRTIGVSAGNTGVCNPGNAECNAELAELLKTWPTLPQAIKAGILAMIRTASGLSR